MENKKHHSDSLFIGIILFFIGGFQNVYTYMNCGKVFANLQTGNMILMSINLVEGNISIALRYLVPLCSFWFGCAIGASVNIKFKYLSKIHWRVILLIIEMINTIIASFLVNPLYSAGLITFNCALTLEAFKEVDHRSLPTTMMIGNMRKAIDYLTKYFLEHHKKDLKEGLFVIGLLLVFIIGAICSALLSTMYGNKTILFLVPLYLTGIIFLQFEDFELIKKNKGL